MANKTYFKLKVRNDTFSLVGGSDYFLNQGEKMITWLKQVSFQINVSCV